MQTLLQGRFPDVRIEVRLAITKRWLLVDQIDVVAQENPTHVESF